MQAVFCGVIAAAGLFAPILRAQNEPIAPAGRAKELVLQLDPATSGAGITLGGSLHNVEGTFQAKRGSIRYDATSGAAAGEIAFDATSGKTGNDSRDRKMHKDVIESARFPEISFRPHHAEGALAPAGDSMLQVHGLFSVHGSDHEITIPVALHIEGKQWKATATFTVPYARWGMKNPSVFLLRVDSEVKVQFHASGSVQP